MSFVTPAVGDSKQRAVPRLRRSAATLALGRPRFDPGPAHVGYWVDGVALGRVSALLWVFPYHHHHRTSARYLSSSCTVIGRTDGQSLDTFRETIFRISQHLTGSDIFVVLLFAENWVNLVL